MDTGCAPAVPVLQAPAPQRHPELASDAEIIVFSEDIPKQAQLSTSISFVNTPDHTNIRTWRGRRLYTVVLSSLLSLLALSQVIGFRNATHTFEGQEELRWIASSSSWLDKPACRWLGVCGVARLNGEDRSTVSTDDTVNGAQGSSLGNNVAGDEIDLSSFWTSGTTDPSNWSEEERLLRDIPQYVLDYAPYVHLYSGEQFWPCDIAKHLVHTTPYLNYTPLQAEWDHPNLTDLSDLNKWGRFVYLQSDDNVEDRPEWLGGRTNIPSKPDNPDDGRRAQERDGQDDHDGQVTSAVSGSREIAEREDLLSEKQSQSLNRAFEKSADGGRSDAPAVLIVIDKGDGIVDAFWFYFYSYNLGNVVLNVRFGNHVGDWEHSVVRFHNGTPKEVFLSEHYFGEAYTYGAVEKMGKRPVCYSSTGTHAMYATPGSHPYVLPFGLLHDMTDRGPLWDPALNMHAFTYDYRNDTLRSSTLTPKAPTSWFYYGGHWGDKFYPLSDPRQYRFAGQYHYVNGPLGPRFKNLGRKRICQGNRECVIKDRIGDRQRARQWEGVGRGEEMSDEDARRLFGRNGTLGEIDS